MPDIAARRWLFLVLVLSSTALSTLQLWGVLRIDGLEPLECAFLLLFALLFGWIAASFWLTAFGAWARWTGNTDLLTATPGPSASRTAMLMPVYNEDVGRIFSGVAAIWESVTAADGAGFDFYILSDSTDPAHWIAEEIEWQSLRNRLPPQTRLFYRHRARNIGRKSGNIQDFCENWGALYDYMVVLDADSLMTGATLRRLVGLMDANPRAALIQAPAKLVGRSSLFARIQQFASSVYGPVHSAGLSSLQGPDGNYWGHNAIIRCRAFLQHGALPKLPGNPPFGGEIMSHDFVEAAFLVRAGWQVWMAPDTGEGSFEEPPPTIYDYLKRDRRWCQGNLQHLRILFAQGLKLPSRLHLAMGIMSYVSSPLWLLLLIVSAVGMRPPPPPVDYAGALPQLNFSVPHTAELLELVLATLVLLYGPKILALMTILRDPKAVRAHGGTAALLWSVVCESLFSTLFAPLVMLVHSWFLFTLVMGITTGWGTQTRRDRALPLLLVLRSYWLPTLAGAAAAGALYRFAPASLGWFVPLLAGLLLAIPLVYLTSSLAMGKWAARRGLFLVASETGTLPILERAHQLQADYAGAPDLHAVLGDPGFVKLHLTMLRQMPGLQDGAPENIKALVDAARARRTGHFTRQDWIALLSDADSVMAVARP